MDEDKKSWGSRLRDSIKGRVKSELDHHAAVKSAYSEAKKQEELKFAKERAKRDVRSGGGSSKTAQRLMNAVQGGGLDSDFGDSGSYGFSGRVSDAIGMGEPSRSRSRSSKPKKGKKKSGKRSSEPRERSFADTVSNALGGF